MMLGVSHGKVKCAMASCGLPRGLSQLSSKAVHMSAPKKGSTGVWPGTGAARPSARRCGVRDSGKRSDAS